MVEFGANLSRKTHVLGINNITRCLWNSRDEEIAITQSVEFARRSIEDSAARRQPSGSKLRAICQESRARSKAVREPLSNFSILYDNEGGDDQKAALCAGDAGGELAREIYIRVYSRDVQLKYNDIPEPSFMPHSRVSMTAKAYRDMSHYPQIYTPRRRGR